uniref:Secreted salivary protein n=1 Tax=Culicoides nubeculosus TaxID=144565 RepID=B9URK6_CULNU|nr:secreted salivary protein [Culicoides nubeculosus]
MHQNKGLWILISTITLISGNKLPSLGFSRTLDNVDPKEHIKGETYEEITRFNQVYFTQEANFGSCNSKCEDYAAPRHNFKEDNRYKFPQRQCTGTIYNCIGEKITEKEPVIRYQIKKPESPESDKRYYYVELPVNTDKKKYQYAIIEGSNYTYRYVYGNKEHSDHTTVNFDTWIRGFVRCDICRCLCDESKDSESIRSFSLNAVESDTKDNKVVIGVQLALKDKIFYFKIRQSPLLPLGKADQRKLSWKSDDPSLSSASKDIFKLDVNKRSIHIGSATSNLSDFVVTGVKFAEIDGNLALGVKLTKFDVMSGKLMNDNNQWIYNSLSKQKLNNGGVANRPIKFTDNHASEKLDLGLVEFRQSDLKDDVGQSTVPFIDLRSIVSTGTALIGVGLQFRTRDTSGGFIAPVVVTHPTYTG